MNRTQSCFAVAALSVAISAGSAHAATVNLSNFTFPAASPVTVSAPNYSGAAGQFVGTLDGDPFTTYCTDLLQSFSFNTNYTDYTIVDGVTAWGAARSDLLDRLLSLAAASNEPSTSARSAAIQAAVWEVLYEDTSNTPDFTTGMFTASSTDGATQTALNALNWAGVLVAQVTLHASQLRSDSTQDFLVLKPVPEPATVALMLAGVAGLFGARARARSA